MSDLRVVYGATCTWWGAIAEAASKASGLPCCPQCGGVLFEVDSETSWWTDVARHEAAGNPGYRAFIEWLRGKCRRDIFEARAEYEAAR